MLFFYKSMLCTEFMRILLDLSCISFGVVTRVKCEADLSCVAAVVISNVLMGILVALAWQHSQL